MRFGSDSCESLDWVLTYYILVFPSLDQRLEQLKAKYQRRRTEDNFSPDSNRQFVIVEKIDEEDNSEQSVENVEKTVQGTDGSRISHRSKSVPLFNLGLPKLIPESSDLDLSVDPLTGLWIDGKGSSQSEPVKELSDCSDVQVTLNRQLESLHLSQKVPKLYYLDKISDEKIKFRYRLKCVSKIFKKKIITFY